MRDGEIEIMSMVSFSLNLAVSERELEENMVSDESSFPFFF